MAIRRTGRLADSIATPNGIVSKDGEMLIRNDGSFYIHSQEFMNNWNGVKPKPKKSEAASYSNRSSKDDLEEYGRTIGVELDKRKSKSSLLKQLKEFKNQLKEELFPKK